RCRATRAASCSSACCASRTGKSASARLAELHLRRTAMNDTKPTARVVRIGGASGFWGDSMVGAPQLVNSGLIDYLVFDYLAETTMAILAATRAKKPELGYATDFVDTVMKQVLPQVMQRGITVIANAGGINPHGCAQALKALADSMGLAPRIAVVLGDDVSAQMAELRESG